MCEDFDAPESSRASLIQQQVQQALIREVGNAHYLLATAELEAWLLLFPQALNKFCDDWSVPNRRLGIDTGKLPDPKQVLRAEVSTPKRRYRETDAPLLLTQAAAQGELHQPTGSNASWTRFIAEAGDCCRSHV